MDAIWERSMGTIHQGVNWMGFPMDDSIAETRGHQLLNAIDMPASRLKTITPIRALLNNEYVE